MDESQFKMQFRPTDPSFLGFSMPSSVPDGLHLELSRSPIKQGQEDHLQEWMGVLNDRYDECVASLPRQRAVFEATFRHQEADGSLWIYHLSLMGSGSSGLDEEQPIDATHAKYSRQIKTPGWEELTPLFMLTPDHLRQAMRSWGETGTEPEQDTDL